MVSPHFLTNSAAPKFYDEKRRPWFSEAYLIQSLETVAYFHNFEENLANLTTKGFNIIREYFFFIEHIMFFFDCV